MNESEPTRTDWLPKDIFLLIAVFLALCIFLGAFWGTAMALLNQGNFDH